MDLDLILTKVKRSGGSGFVKLDNGETYEVKKLTFSPVGFVSFESMCGKYIKHSGSYTFYTRSKNHH